MSRRRFASWRESLPSRRACAAAALSALLLALAFPNFDLHALAWVALVPLFVAVIREPVFLKGFSLGWITGAIYFYASCYWVTYPMIRYAGIPAPVAYLLLAPATLILGLFPALACGVLARVVCRWGVWMLLAAAPLWTGGEWLRLEITGQLWNALGYTQAFELSLIQAARWGGVYAVSFLIVTINAAVAYLLVSRSKDRFILTPAVLALSGLVVWWSAAADPSSRGTPVPDAAAVVIAVQPNVIPDFDRPTAELRLLFQRHLKLSAEAFREIDVDPSRRDLPRVVIFPESPMNFRYANDAAFRDSIADFAAEHRTRVLFNSLEPAPAGGGFNSAVLVDERGRLVEQYDKIGLLAFGEYVPLPSWLPGREFVRGVVGEFTPGERFALMPLTARSEEAKAGVFICFESTLPHIARRFTDAGATTLVNISNDAYQGRTAVLRQHLANSVFRAVENDRELLRITNTGITARISPRGEITDVLPDYTPAARAWTIGKAKDQGKTFYTIYGDTFAVLCVVTSVVLYASTTRLSDRLFRSRNQIERQNR